MGTSKHSSSFHTLQREFALFCSLHSTRGAFDLLRFRSRALMITLCSSWRPGGNRRLAICGWLVASSFYLCDVFLRLSVDVVTNDVQREFNMTAEEVSSAFGSSFFWSYALMQIPAGWLLDAVGPSRTISGCALLCGFASLGFGYSRTAASGIIARIVMGLASSGGWLGALKVSRLGFGSANRAANLVLGITCMLGGVGGLGSQEPFRQLAAAVSWRDAFKIVSALPFAISALALLLISDASTTEGESADAQEEEEDDDDNASPTTTWRDIISTPRLWMCAIYLGTTDGPFELYTSLWGVSYLKQAGHFSPSAAATMTTVIVIVATVGQMLAGPLLTVTLASRKRQVMSLLILALVGIVSMSFPVAELGRSVAASWSSVLLLGVTVTSCVIVWEVISSDALCCGSRATGLVSGMVNTVCMALDAALQMLVGAILTSNWEGSVDAKGGRVYSPGAYAKAFAPVCCCFCVASICMVVLAVIVARKKNKRMGATMAPLLA